MDIPEDLWYTKEHEWVKLDGGVVTCGITDYAQDSLGDIVFVELPEVDAKIEKGKQAGVVESVKSVSDIFAPVSGRIVEVNNAVEDSPEKVNKSPYGDGWLFKMKVEDESDVEELLNAKEYLELVGETGQ
jgi:glycine cleavage system H protein